MSHVRSFKLKFREEYGRIVPSMDLHPLTLRGEEARRAIELAAPIEVTLRAFEPEVHVRSLSLDLARPRLLATLEPTTPDADARGRVVRLEAGPALDLVLASAAPLLAYLDALVETRAAAG